jgi:hypothetical protein
MEDDVRESPGANRQGKDGVGGAKVEKSLGERRMWRLGSGGDERYQGCAVLLWQVCTKHVGHLSQLVVGAGYSSMKMPEKDRPKSTLLPSTHYLPRLSIGL